MKRIIDFIKHQPFAVLALVSCAVLFMSFSEVVDEVLEGDSHAIDEKILLMLRDQGNASSPLGPPWLEEMMRDITGLGGIAILWGYVVNLAKISLKPFVALGI